MTLSAAQIEALAYEAGVAMQEIQIELGRDGAGGVVRFPRGYLKTVGERIGKIAWIGDETLKRNLCYHLIFGDVLRWLLNRTDLWGVARGMVVKQTIALMGGVAESLTFEAMRRLKYGKRNFGRRVEQLFDDFVIDKVTRDELLWLWDARAAIHVYEVTNLEVDKYEVKHSNRAIRAVRALADALEAEFLRF